MNPHESELFYFAHSFIIHAYGQSYREGCAHRIINTLSDTANFEEVLYQLYVRKKVEEGLQDIQSGNIIPDDEMAKFWLKWSEK